TEHLKAAQLAEQRAFGFTQWQHAMMDTKNFAGGITDSAASATAMATGTLTVNHAVGQNLEGDNLQTIMDVAHQKGMRTGFVTTDYLYGATPAAFSGHAPNRDNSVELFKTQLESDLNLMCATYNDTVGLRSDLITPSNFSLCSKFAKREEIANAQQALCLFDLEGYGRSVSLADAATFALDFLQNENGFVLMIEQAHADKYSHNSMFSNAVNAVVSLDNTVTAVQNWIGDRLDTALIVTADHETCGLQVSQEDTLPKKATFNSGVTLYYDWTADYHTDADVDFFYNGFYADLSQLPVFSDAEKIKNSDVFLIMQYMVQAITAN
ncbi:MAG: alkaline phosphatase, partial [Candidatus Fimimonas sp.]